MKENEAWSLVVWHQILLYGCQRAVPGVLSFRIVHRRLTIIYDVIKACCPGPCSSANSKDLQQFTYSTIISAPLSRNPKISFFVLLSRSCFLWTSSPVFSVDFHNCHLPSNLHSHHDMLSGHQQSPNFKVEFLHVWEYSHRCASPTGVSEGNNPGGLWCWAEEVWLPIQTVCVVFMWKSNIQLQSVALKTRVPSLFPGVIVWMLKWKRQTTRWCTCYHFTCVWRQSWRKGILTEQFIIIEYMIRLKHHQLDFIENMIIWVHA